MWSEPRRKNLMSEYNRTKLEYVLGSTLNTSFTGYLLEFFEVWGKAGISPGGTNLGRVSYHYPLNKIPPSHTPWNAVSRGTTPYGQSLAVLQAHYYNSSGSYSVRHSFLRYHTLRYKVWQGYKTIITIPQGLKLCETQVLRITCSTKLGRVSYNFPLITIPQGLILRETQFFEVSAEKSLLGLRTH